MHDHQKCLELFAQLSEYIDQDLDAVTCQAIDKHLQQCPPCQACLSTLKRTVKLCKQMGQNEMPHALQQSLREMITQKF